MEQLGSHWKDFHEILYFSIFRKSVVKIQVSSKYDKNNGYFTWRPIYIFIISRSLPLRMKIVSEKSYRNYKNTHFTFNNAFFSENRAVYEIMCKNIVKPEIPQMTIWLMRIACWICTATNTQNMQYLLLLHCNNGYTKAPQCFHVACPVFHTFLSSMG